MIRYNLINTLNLKNLELLSNKHVSSAISDNAGKFMCNANFYWNQHKINNEKHKIFLVLANEFYPLKNTKS